MGRNLLAHYEEIVRENIATVPYKDTPVTLGDIIGAKKPIDVIDINGDLFTTDTSACINTVKPVNTCLFISEGSVEDYVSSGTADELTVQFGIRDMAGKLQSHTHKFNLEGYDVGLSIAACVISDTVPHVNGGPLYPVEFDNTLTQEL